jgi:CubicO group peptidase (beta-lactamase class C family)
MRPLPRIAVIAVCLLTFLALRAFADEPSCAPPTALADGWETSAPDASGFDTAVLCAVLAGVANGREDIHGVIIERHGRLVAELYRSAPDHPVSTLYGLWNPFGGTVAFGPTTLHDVRSVTKSIVSLLVGIALERGKIASIATPVLDFYPDLADLRSPQRNAITLAHLLTMSSGLQWDENGFPNDETRLYWKSNPSRFLLSRPVVAEPGTTFNYNGGGTTVVAEILVRTSGQRLKEAARQQLFEPLGITDWQWVGDLHGRELPFSGLRMRPRDLAKVGRMLLDHGRWRGRQIVPVEWVTESLRPRISTGVRAAAASEPLLYGYQWWSATIAWRGKMLAWIAGFGNGGQRLFLVPDLDLIVVITAGAYDSPGIGGVVNRLFAQVVAAARE